MIFKKSILLAALIFSTMLTYAQSDKLVVQNTTTVSFDVIAVATDAGCSNPTLTLVQTIAPGASATFNPPLGSSADWSSIGVVPTPGNLGPAGNFYGSPCANCGIDTPGILNATWADCFNVRLSI